MNQDNDDIFNDIDPEVNHFAEIFPDLNNSVHSDYYSIDKFNENCPNQPHLLNKYQINMGFSHFHEFGSYLGCIYWHHIK